MHSVLTQTQSMEIEHWTLVKGQTLHFEFLLTLSPMGGMDSAPS